MESLSFIDANNNGKNAQYGLGQVFDNEIVIGKNAAWWPSNIILEVEKNLRQPMISGK